MNDTVEIRNNDSNKILGTVAKKTIEFLEINPKAYIVATGSTQSRTRKYQMGLNKNLHDLLEKYIVAGFIAKRNLGMIIGAWPNWDGTWVEFKSGINYDAFLLRVK